MALYPGKVTYKSNIYLPMVWFFMLIKIQLSVFFVFIRRIDNVIHAQFGSKLHVRTEYLKQNFVHYSDVLPATIRGKN